MEKPEPPLRDGWPSLTAASQPPTTKDERLVVSSRAQKQASVKAAMIQPRSEQMVVKLASDDCSDGMECQHFHKPWEYVQTVRLLHFNLGFGTAACSARTSSATEERHDLVRVRKRSRLSWKINVFLPSRWRKPCLTVWPLHFILKVPMCQV